MLDRLKDLRRQMGGTFWLALVLVVLVLVLIAVGMCRLVGMLGGRAVSEVTPAAPTPAGVAVESRPMEVPVEGTAVGIDPAWQRIGPGTTTELTIRIENAVRLYGAEVHLAFDPASLEVQDADPDADGIQLQPGDFPKPDFVVRNQADNVMGTIDYAISQMAPREPIDGSGVLAKITVKTKGEGSSWLAFTEAKLANPDGQQIPAEVLNGEIVVAVGAVSVQPTPAVEESPTATPIVLATPFQTPAPTIVPGVPAATPSPTEPSVLATAVPTVTPSPTPVQAEPTATPPPPAVTGGCYYIVRRGDTVFSIARRFGTTISAIAQANSLANPRYILAGQRLIIPGVYSACAPSYAVPGAKVYIVQRGDTMYSIARRYHTTVWAIARANGIANPSHIWVGQRLVIPAGCW